MKKIALLGSTGSIGRQVIACAERYPERYKIISLAAGGNAKLLSSQINKLRPAVAALCDASKAGEIGTLPKETTLYTGENAALQAVMSEADLVFVAVMGFAGLKTVLEAIQTEQLSRVRDLLRTTALSITEISYRYNFRSENHLKRLFKKSFGMTMRDYRRQNQA